MPFGLHSAPTFQRLLDSVIGPELEPNVPVYLDDIVIANRTFGEHLRHLGEVFRRLHEAKLRLNPEKCHFCCDSLRYLSRVVDRQGIHIDSEKVSAITGWHLPLCARSGSFWVWLPNIEGSFQIYYCGC